MNNKLFFISTTIIIIIISIIWITISLFTPDNSPKEIISGNIKGMLFKESFTGEFKVINTDNIQNLESDFNLEIQVLCSEVDSLELNKKNFVKLEIETNKGYESYQVDNGKNVIKKIYQPNIKNKLAENYNEIFYSCEDSLIEEYKTKIKNMI